MSDALIQDLGRLSADPFRFVLWAFPWGEIGTELATRTGPEEWQRTLLCQVRDGLLTKDQAIQEAVASGHGVGKSALVSWLTLWAFSTFPGTRGVITANTETQLKTKTWVELSKWFRLFIAKEMFQLSATRLSSLDPDLENEWRIDQVAWSERTVESFAGLHNQGKRILVVFDEASAIPDNIWETTEGALTDSDTQILWFVFGNPTRSTGRFRECFPGGRHFSTWHTTAVDSRTVTITNKDQIAKWVKAYGEDSDFVRVRVKGQFPRVGAMEFISIADVELAMQREPQVHLHDPLVLGVDVARFGDDKSVIFIRKGRDAATYPPLVFSGVDTMALAGKVAEAFGQYHADAVFVDGGGVGGGVVDRLRQLHVPVIEVQFGGKPDRLGTGESSDDGTQYANKRAEMWGFMRAALRDGLALPSESTEWGRQIKEELVGPQYGFNAANAIQLERKEDMKKRGLASPDLADGLALTYAYAVIPHALAGREGPRRPPSADTEYNPFAEVA